MKKTRRTFLRQSGHLTLGVGLLGLSACGDPDTTTETEEENTTAMDDAADLFFKISLAQWSMNQHFFSGKLDNLDFAAKAKSDFGIEAIEYVNQFFKDKAEDTDYLGQMKQRAADNGVKSLLIMVDGEGGLGSLDDTERLTAVENHYKWVDAAKFLGCHSIRVNAFGRGTAEEVEAAAIDGLSRLSEYAAQENINVLVENHGGHSSNGQWLASVMANVGMDNCGTLPDFGNFCIKRSDGSEWSGECLEEYDRYKGVREMMPYAKAVSAKAHEFNEAGEEIHTDYMQMMQIIKDAGYTGYVGIEYEGDGMTAEEGIMATKNLLLEVGKKLS